ncbi:MAG TPA: fibronectin type III domain-containing protein, partial [Frankiaceae bacterium]|nr:fibronectin type III domain-containing protein [Frankiaceae bacterium]
MQLRPHGGSRPALAALVTAGLLLGSATSAAAAEAPALTSVAPTSAPVGADVSLAGSGLAGATSVTFNGTTATFRPNGDGQLFATVPAAATDGPVSVVTPDGTATLPFDVDEAPAAVTGLTARGGDGLIRLSWTAPADPTGVVVRRAEGSTAPASTTDGTEVMASGSGLTDTGLVNGQTYSYAVWAKDSAGSLSPSAVVSAVPAPAVVSALRIGLSAARVVSGASVTVIGVLSDPGGSGLAGEGVTLLNRPRGAT